MKASKENTAPYFFKAWKLLGLAALFLLVNEVSYAQNTKGAEVNRGSSPKRENRFRILPKKKKQKSGGGGTYKRVQGRPSSANSARKMPSSKPRKIYSQGGRSVNYSSKKDTQKAWKGDITGRKIRAPRDGDKARKVYPQYGRYSSNASRKSKDREPKVVSNRSKLARLNRMQGSHLSSGGKKQVVTPRSASHAFIARKSINVYANFARPKPKKERAHTKDISGRKLRTKNFETPRREVIMPNVKVTRSRKSIGDIAYKGRASGGHQSASRRSERAWKGNISGNKIRGRNYSSKPRIEGRPIFPRSDLRPYGKDRRYRGSMPPTSGNRSASRPGESRTGKRPLAVRAPGKGANRIGTFQGNIKGRRPAVGGGSASGRSWNNKQQALPVRVPNKNAIRAGRYQGSLKVLGRSVPGYADQGEGFSGYKKASRPLKGGGSISGRMWNNKSSSLPVRTPKPSAARAGTYQGSIKRFSKSQPGFGDQGEGFSGYKKTKKPLKGGGSVSGRIWNNKEKALPVRTPSPAARRAGTFQGNAKQFEQTPTMMDQGEEFTGFIKLRRFKKNYVKNPNSAEAAIKKKYPSKSTYEVDGLQVRVKERNYVQNKNAAKESVLKKSPTKGTYQTGELQIKVKQREYVQNKNAAKESLLKKKPSKSTYLVDGLQVKVRQREYDKKPNAADGSMPGIKPSKSSVKASEYARGVKQTWKYVRNPSSADEAQKTREPGKAFGRATDYQGNIKMQKFHLFEKNRHLHPDATFVKTNKNNVDGERDLLTNVKLWWAKLFKKQDTQPDNLKDKGKRPRYDNREDGLWYD